MIDQYIADQIDYPDSWDTSVYETLAEALWELYEWAQMELEMEREKK